MYIHQQLAVDPTAKFVAFTEYTFQFHLLDLALHLANILAELVVHDASEYPPIDAFKTNTNMRVLVMPFSKCAAGISLCEGTHILFLHPFAGLAESPWNRDMDSLTAPYVHFAPPSTEQLDKLNADQKRVCSEWEKRCVEMMVKGHSDRAGPVRIVRFVIRNSIEEQFELDASVFSQ